MVAEKSFLVKYVAVVKELSDGETFELEGHFVGISTKIKDGKLIVGGLLRDTKGEIV